MIEMIKVGWDLLGNQVFGSIILLALFVILGFMLVLGNYKIESNELSLILIPLCILLSTYVGFLTPVGLLFLAFAFAPIIWKLMGQQY